MPFLQIKSRHNPIVINKITITTDPPINIASFVLSVWLSEGLLSSIDVIAGDSDVIVVVVMGGSVERSTVAS